DSPQQLIKAFAAAGIRVPSTRSQVLREVEHPALAPLLAYKELSRLSSFHGWTWVDQLMRDGRFHPEYVVGGVVSGRWATSGGGALQIPKALRRAVVADDGWRLVVADAAQLEPRVLAAMSGDRGLAGAAGEIDLYSALAQAFGGDRQSAKIAMLSAMYGGRPRGRARRGAWCAPGWAAPARRRHSAGESWCRVRRAAGPPATAAGSPATSSSRPPRRSGRWYCWPCCGAACPSRPGWCSSST